VGQRIVINNGGSEPYHVCSILIMRGFGEGQKDGYTRNAGTTDYGLCATDYNDFVKEMRRAALHLDKQHPIANNAMITAYATTLQPMAQSWLRQAGFTEFAVPEFLKYDHGISQFTMPIVDFCALIGIPYAAEQSSHYFSPTAYARDADAELEAARLNASGEIQPEDAGSLSALLRNMA
jgi:hypothetical protein